MNNIRRRKISRQAGFALLEILVATAIAAVSLTILYGMIATSMRTAQSEKATIEASLLARSLLAEVTSGALSEPGEHWSEPGSEPRWRLRLLSTEEMLTPGARRFLTVELAIWHLGEGRAPLEFATEVSIDGETTAAQ